MNEQQITQQYLLRVSNKYPDYETSLKTYEQTPSNQTSSEQTPVQTYILNLETKIKEQECPICLEKIECKHCFCLLSCGHHSHSFCLHRINKCPICRN